MKTQNDAKKILFIHHATGWGGASISLFSILKSLDQTKYDAKVFVFKKSVVSEKLKENGINVVVAESAFYRKHYRYLTHSEAGYVKWYQVFRFFWLTILWGLSRYYFAKYELGKHDYDIVHLNSSVLSDWLAPAKKRGKVIIHIREPFRKGKADALRLFLRRQMKKYADHIIAISKDNASRIGIPEKTTVIYNHYSAISEVQYCSDSSDSYVSKKVLYLGGAMKIKGFYTMVAALDYLDKSVTVLFAGNYLPQTQKNNIIKQIIKLVLAYGRKKQTAIKKIRNHPNATFVGHVSSIFNLLNEVCCLALPFSVPHFARPVFEAHFHKKPVIGSDVEGMAEIIEHEVNGLIVPKDDPKALAAAINELTNDSAKAKRLGEAGYDVAKERFTDKNVTELEKLYRKLLS